MPLVSSSLWSLSSPVTISIIWTKTQLRILLLQLGILWISQNLTVVLLHGFRMKNEELYFSAYKCPYEV